MHGLFVLHDGFCKVLKKVCVWFFIQIEFFEKTRGYFVLFQILCNTGSASSIVVCGMCKALIIRTGTEWA